MWQNQKLSTLLALGLAAIFTATGCATTVEEPVVDGQDEMTVESSEALTAGGGWGGYGRGLRGGKFHGGFGKWGGYGPPAWGLRRGYLGYGYGDYDYGYDYDYFDRDFDRDGDTVVIVENNIGGYGGYGDYGPDYLPDYDYGYDKYDDCGGAYVEPLLDDCYGGYGDDCYGDYW